MRINVGSKNNIKIIAVRETISDYDSLSTAKVLGLNVSSEISKQPKSLDETILGSINRARNAFQDCDLSFGLEDGLMKVPYSNSDYMNICACVIYDGQNNHLGLSPAFEYSQDVTKLVINEGLDINQAFYRVGLTTNKKIGSAEGTIGFLTNGRLIRKEYTKQAIMMALIHLEK